MRITSIELAGSIENGKKLPRAFATIIRKIGDEFITVQILAPGGERTHHVQTDDRDDQWSMAKILQHALDGYDSTEGDIAEYLRTIQLFAD